VDDDDYAGFDTSADDEDATIPCPHCGADVYDDAEQCPACGQYLLDADAPAAGRPWWIVIGVAICLLIVIAWALSR
jgi:rRNA maturation protein Nop10